MKSLKYSVVALGLVKSGGSRPKVVVGTGFLISPKGYIMTAAHVIHACDKLAKIYSARGEPTEIVAFSLLFKKPRLHFETMEIDAKRMYLKPERKAEGYIMSDDLDVAVLRVKKKIRALPFLRIKEPTSDLRLYTDIVMCGYPNGNQTLNVTKEFLGVRLSPVVQFGKIVNFMPLDEAPTPNGIQTDIVSTGGSSGSPIVELSTGEVVAIAQEVIAASVVGRTREILQAKVGIVYGITNEILFPASQKVDEFYEHGTKVVFDYHHTSFTDPSFTRV